MMLSVPTFTGTFPKTPPHLLANNAAQTAKNCDVRQGELRPMPGLLPALTSLPAGVKGVFSDKGLTFLTSQSPMRAALSPTIDDLYSRVYYTNDAGFRVSRWTDTYEDGRAVESWMVGVPTPKAKLIAEKRRKNRWPGYPGAVPKARFFFEADGQRFGETDVSLTGKAGAPAFSAYTFDAGVDLQSVVREASLKKAVPGETLRCAAIYFVLLTTTTDSLGNEVSFSAGWNASILGYDVTITQSGVQIKSGAGAGGVSSVDASRVTKLRTLSGEEITIDYAGESDSQTAVPEYATPAVEFWIENTDGARLATVYSSNSSFAYGASAVPGGMALSITPTGDTNYELNLSFGTMETRAYVYTMVNDWVEESAPSDPVIVDVTFMEDVVLRVDYDECVAQLQGYRPFDHVQFYCAANNTTYLAVKTAPNSAANISDLYYSILWRAPDATGLAFWEQEYANGASLASIAAQMKQSNEYLRADVYLILERVYTTLLNRQSDDAGLQYWIGKFNQGISVKAIIWEFLNSTEMAARYPSGRPSITQYYQMFLGRAPEPEGLAYWQSVIAPNPAIEATLLFEMLSGNEYQSTKVQPTLTEMLTTLYGRAPTSGELSTAQAMLDDGHSFNSVAYIISSSLGADGTGHVDEGDDRYLGWTLTSTTWTAPYPDMKMLTVLPNGVFAASRDRTIYFSEPYRPYAWPDIYAQTLPFEVVGLRAFEGQILVVTSGEPYMVSGAHPEGMTQQRVTASSAAVAEWGVSEVAGRPAYASRDGIVLIEGTRASLDFSRNFWTPELWRQKYGSRLSSIKLVSYNDALLGLFDSGDGFVLHYDEQQPHMVEISETGGYPFTIPGSSAVYLARPTGVVSVVGLDGAAPRNYVWHSKEFTLPANTSFAVCKIVVAGSTTVTLYADGVQYHQATATSSNLGEVYLRLPSPGRYLRFSLKLEGTGVVRSIELAHSIAEMRNAA